MKSSLNKTIAILKFFFKLIKLERCVMFVIPFILMILIVCFTYNLKSISWISDANSYLINISSFLLAFGLSVITILFTTNIHGKEVALKTYLPEKIIVQKNADDNSVKHSYFDFLVIKTTVLLYVEIFLLLLSFMGIFITNVFIHKIIIYICIYMLFFIAALIHSLTTSLYYVMMKK